MQANLTIRLNIANGPFYVFYLDHRNMFNYQLLSGIYMPTSFKRDALAIAIPISLTVRKKHGNSQL